MADAACMCFTLWLPHPNGHVLMGRQWMHTCASLNWRSTVQTAHGCAIDAPQFRLPMVEHLRVVCPFLTRLYMRTDLCGKRQCWLNAAICTRPGGGHGSPNGAPLGAVPACLVPRWRPLPRPRPCFTLLCAWGGIFWVHAGMGTGVCVPTHVLVRTSVCLLSLG